MSILGVHMKIFSKFTQSYLNYRQPTETGGVSYVERLPVGSNKSGKTHLVLHFRKIVMGEVSALIKHEEKILDHLTKHQVPHTVRLLDYQNSPNYQQPEKSTQTIVTQAAGVDLDDWFEAPIFINELNRSLNNIYEHPLFVLAILKGSLNALWQIHQLDIVHCDIKMDNICLPYHGGEADKGETIQIQLDKVTLIDFGTSYWIGNLGNSERLWLGYNENENERYQSQLLINILKKWNQDNQNKSEPPYNNASLNQINYSCDLYGLGVAFECFCIQHQYADAECWSLVSDDFNAIIRELKSYDNGIPARQAQMPHQALMQKLDILIQKVISYEHAQGNTIYPSHVNGKMTVLPKHPTRRTPPVPTPTPFPLTNSIGTPPVVNELPFMEQPPTTTDAENEKKGFGKKMLIGGGVLLLAMGGLAMLNKNSSLPKDKPAFVEEVQTTDESPAEATTEPFTKGITSTSDNNIKNETQTNSEPNIFDKIADDSVDYSQFKLIKTIDVSVSSVRDLDFSPDNKYIITASDATKSSVSNIIFDVVTGEKVKEYEGGNTSVIYSPDQKYIVTANQDMEERMDSKISVYSINEDRIIKEDNGGDMEFYSSLTFSPNGDYLLYALGGEGVDVVAQHYLTGKSFAISEIAPELMSDIINFSFLGDYNPNLVAVSGSRVGIIDLETKELLFKTSTYRSVKNKEPTSIERLALSPNGKWIATIDSDMTIRVEKFSPFQYTVTPHKVIESDLDVQDVGMNDYEAQDLLFTPDSLYLIHKKRKAFDIYRVSDMKKMTSIATPKTSWGLDVSSDGKYIAVGTSYPKGQVLIYGIE